MTHPASADTTDIVVIGAGFAGLAMAIRLQQAGHRYMVLEQADRLGGTWRDNRYPGCACDIPSTLYCLSFAPNPEWSRIYPSQAEIWAYQEQLADRFGLLPHIRLNAAVTEARWDAAQRRWRLTLGNGERLSARIVISAAGFLTQPSIPEIDGLDHFEGAVFHSARWDANLTLAGKRVAVIGTGASAIQIVPSIAPEVAKLLVFQRTPAWIVPKADRALSESERRLLRRFPLLQRLMRLGFYLQHELRAVGFTRYPEILKRREKEVLAYLTHSVRDPRLRAKLQPSYTLGCKRVLPSNDFYPAIQRDNVELVTDGIARIEADAIVTRDGAKHRVDAIVLATGFLAAEGGAPFRTIGLDGVDLDERWRRGAEAYLGTGVAGFPNLFLLLGPNTGLGHNSMLYMIESQVHYVMRALAAMRRRSVEAITVRAEAQTAYNREIRSRLARTVWATGGCRSWYQRRDGRITTLWPGYTFEFRRRLRRVRWTDYQALA